MTLHRAQYNGRHIEIETELRDDGRFHIRAVRVEVRKGPSIVIDEMPYEAMPSHSEKNLVDQATVAATDYVKRRL